MILARADVSAVLNRMLGINGLIARLLYGSGLRLMEAVRLRVKDLDLERCEILVRDVKGAKDRVTMLSSGLVEPLRAHLVLVHELHTQDLAAGLPGVYLPLEEKLVFASLTVELPEMKYSESLTTPMLF